MKDVYTNNTLCAAINWVREALAAGTDIEQAIWGACCKYEGRDHNPYKSRLAHFLWRCDW